MTSLLRFLLCALLLATSTAVAQSFDKARLDSLCELLTTHDKGMGSLALSRNGVRLYSRAFGRCDQDRPADVHTKYRIGSISKVFTAVMIFQLVEEGKLTLETPLATWFPQLPNAKQITVGLMLGHRSGLYNFTNDSTYLIWNTQPKSQAELLTLFAGQLPVFAPDEKAEYSNTNYVLLGFIIEKITKKPYKDALQARICAKIGLKETYYGGKTDPAKNECRSYQRLVGWEPAPETDMSIPGGAGSLVATPSDLTLFIEALFAGRLVKPASLDAMTAIRDHYGKGLFQFPFGERRSYGHTGGIDGFSSMLSYFPEDSLAVAYCGNGVVYPVNDLMIGALSIYFGRPYVLPVFAAPLQLTPEALDKYVGVYASTQIPIKITVTREGAVLKAQATGQSGFALEASAPDVFKFDPAQVVMAFAPAEGTFVLKQGGGEFLFKRE